MVLEGKFKDPCGRSTKKARMAPFVQGEKQQREK